MKSSFLSEGEIPRNEQEYLGKYLEKYLGKIVKNFRNMYRKVYLKIAIKFDLYKWGEVQ